MPKLPDETLYLSAETLASGREALGKALSKPLLCPAGMPPFGVKEKDKNATQGYTIALNDIWGTEVSIKNYALNGKSYEVSYRVRLWDHFGLDAPDLDGNKPAAYGAGFRAWFILQHFRGYKPFITKITFDKTFKGEIP